MADVRALLKAKRQEAKITHPLASYNQAGQLRCIVCGAPVKHASAWEGHLGSKIHRTNVARLKEEERVREAQRLREEQEQATAKRKAEEDTSDSEGSETKKRKLDEAPLASSFPADFFSDPNRAPLPAHSDDDDDDDEEDTPTIAPEAAPAAPAAPSSVIDLEYERFQRELLKSEGGGEAYERATVFAEPELASETPEGFPPIGEAAEEPVAESKLTEEEARKAKEQEERELIMDRLLDEERAQEEADMKVSLMKAKLEGLRKKREAAKAAKMKSSKS